MPKNGPLPLEGGGLRQDLLKNLTCAASRMGVLLSLAIGTQLVSPSAFGAAVAVPGFPAGYGAGFHDSPAAPEIVVIPPGAGVMGSTDDETTREARAPAAAAFEKPRHQVSLTHALGVGKYPVTVLEYGSFVAATHRAVTGGCMVLEGGKWQLDQGKSFRDPAYPQTARFPAVCVDWQDAQDYVAWLSASTGHRYRLLHDGEFEYAGRGGTQSYRWWGDSQGALCAHANGADRSFDRANPGDAHVNRSCDDGFAFASPVGSFPPNPFGLYDMLGNVWEWTDDCFLANYQNASTDISAEVKDGDCRVRDIRGGSWHNYPNVLRAAIRYSLPVGMRSSSLGFRVARMPD
jgi:sulfatase modifying factor 1